MARQTSSGTKEGKWIRRDRMTYVRRAMPPFGVTGFHLVYFPGGCVAGGLAVLSTVLAALTLLTIPAYFFAPEEKPAPPGMLAFLIMVASLPTLMALHGLAMGLVWMFRSDADWDKVMRARDRRDETKD
jgi:hypothetical protein